MLLSAGKESQLPGYVFIYDLKNKHSLTNFWQIENILLYAFV